MTGASVAARVVMAPRDRAGAITTVYRVSRRTYTSAAPIARR